MIFIMMAFYSPLAVFLFLAILERVDERGTGVTV